MTTQNYLVVENNIVTNDVFWDGDVNTWQPPTDAIMLVQQTTPCLNWNWNGTEWVLEEQIGYGTIGCTWDGIKLTTNEPKPVNPPPNKNQPVSTGTIKA